MIRDVTFGQYIDRRSLAHQLDARTKLLLVILYIVMLFASKTAAGLAVSMLLVPLCYAVSRIPFRMALRSIKPIVPLLLFTSVLNVLFTAGETVLVQFWRITITREGLVFALLISLRILCLLAGTSLLTYTTSPIELTDGIERAAKPLQRIGFPAHELAMMMTIALRFIPTLIDETDKIMSAQKARGAAFDTGNLVQRIRAMVPILVPLFVSSFRRADELAVARECRCYHGGEGRTRMKTTRMGGRDLAALLLAALLLAAVLVTNHYLPAVI